MDATEKTEFVKEFMDSVQKSVLDAIQHMPEEWDGIELRQYIADQFARESSYLQRKDNRKRLRSYRNAVAVQYGL